ncbi:hypothetical protein D3C72_1356280 [compost metagenome]
MRQLSCVRSANRCRNSGDGASLKVRVCGRSFTPKGSFAGFWPGVGELMVITVTRSSRRSGTMALVSAFR